MGNHEWITSWLPDQHNDKDIAILKYDFQCLNLIYILQKMNNLDLHQPHSASTYKERKSDRENLKMCYVIWCICICCMVFKLKKNPYFVSQKGANNQLMHLLHQLILMSYFWRFLLTRSRFFFMHGRVV